MKKTAIFFIIITTSTIILIWVLVLIGTDRKNNSFRRKFVTIHLKLKAETGLSNNLFGFVGDSDEDILLNNYSYSDQKRLYKIDWSLKHLDTIPISYPKLFNSGAHNIYKDYYASNFYFSNPYGDIATFTGYEKSYFAIRNPRFDFIKAISPRTIIARFRKDGNNDIDRGLVKLSLSKNVKISKEFLFPKQRNAFFANDGLLTYDAINCRILYMYYYRGEFLSLDTNLNVIYNGKTIDTVRHPNIKSGILETKTKDGKNNRQLTQLTPPKFVNKFIVTSGAYLYIISALKADNESNLAHSNNNTIDVYDIRSGRYSYSFYIPKYLGRKLDQFRIKANLLAAIYGPYMITYEFNENAQ